jgi:hypothetical protein
MSIERCPAPPLEKPAGNSIKLEKKDFCNNLPIEKIDAFSLILPYFSRIFSALKVKLFQPDFAIFFTCFFSPTVKTLNILSALKFMGSHLAFYE